MQGALWMSMPQYPGERLAVMASTRARSLLLGLGVGLGAGIGTARAFEESLFADISLDRAAPIVTDTCWLDVRVGGDPELQRVEVALFGDVTPLTAANFKTLCSNQGIGGVGYRGSCFFRLISNFSVQAGNIGQPLGEPDSRLGRYGRAASGIAFPAENFRISHDCETAGVVSMMKDITNGGLQDSRSAARKPVVVY
jgi:hypothetical protein